MHHRPVRTAHGSGEGRREVSPHPDELRSLSRQEKRSATHTLISISSSDRRMFGTSPDRTESIAARVAFLMARGGEEP